MLCSSISLAELKFYFKMRQVTTKGKKGDTDPFCLSCSRNCAGHWEYREDMSLSPRNLWEKSQELEDKGTNVSERIALKDSGNVGSDGEGTDG